jgi:hypothetical protein
MNGSREFTSPALRRGGAVALRTGYRPGAGLHRGPSRLAEVRRTIAATNAGANSFAQAERASIYQTDKALATLATLVRRQQKTPFLLR